MARKDDSTVKKIKSLARKKSIKTKISRKIPSNFASERARNSSIFVYSRT